MELHRSRGALAGGVLFLAGGLFVLFRAGGTVWRLAVGGVIVLLAVSVLVRELRPFRFRIGTEGLDLRTAGIRRLVPWPEIDAVLLHQPTHTPGTTPAAPVLLLVPAPGAPPAGTPDTVSPLDDRPAVLLLDTSDVREPVAGIARGLAQYGGDRFVDVRVAARAPESPAFVVVLRGYDRNAVDGLIRLGRDALASTDMGVRRAARERIDDPRLDVALRGYDRGQVDAHLLRLSAELATG